MSDEEIIMKKDDYHKILDIIGFMLKYYDDEIEEVIDIKRLLEKAKPHEEDN